MSQNGNETKTSCPSHFILTAHKILNGDGSTGRQCAGGVHYVCANTHTHIHTRRPLGRHDDDSVTSSHRCHGVARTTKPPPRFRRGPATTLGARFIQMHIHRQPGRRSANSHGSRARRRRRAPPTHHNGRLDVLSGPRRADGVH
jgi:hypothetical protein